MNRVVAAVSGAAVLAVCVSGCGKIPVKGSITVTDSSSVTAFGGSCKTDSGYDDIQSGANVVIKNSKGDQVALGSLDAGERTADGGCKFTFEVDDVPKGDLYTISVGNRKDYSFQRDEASSLDLTLG